MNNEYILRASIQGQSPVKITIFLDENYIALNFETKKSQVFKKITRLTLAIFENLDWQFLESFLDIFTLIIFWKFEFR